MNIGKQLQIYFYMYVSRNTKIVINNLLKKVKTVVYFFPEYYYKSTIKI